MTGSFHQNLSKLMLSPIFPTRPGQRNLCHGQIIIAARRLAEAVGPDALNGISSSANAVSRMLRFSSCILPPSSCRLRVSSDTPEMKVGHQDWKFVASRCTRMHTRMHLHIQAITRKNQASFLGASIFRMCSCFAEDTIDVGSEQVSELLGHILRDLGTHFHWCIEMIKSAIPQLVRTTMNEASRLLLLAPPAFRAKHARRKAMPAKTNAQSDCYSY